MAASGFGNSATAKLILTDPFIDRAAFLASGRPLSADPHLVTFRYPGAIFQISYARPDVSRRVRVRFLFVRPLFVSVRRLRQWLTALSETRQKQHVRQRLRQAHYCGGRQGAMTVFYHGKST